MSTMNRKVMKEKWVTRTEYKSTCKTIIDNKDEDRTKGELEKKKKWLIGSEMKGSGEIILEKKDEDLSRGRRVKQEKWITRTETRGLSETIVKNENEDLSKGERLAEVGKENQDGSCAMIRKNMNTNTRSPLAQIQPSYILVTGSEDDSIPSTPVQAGRRSSRRRKSRRLSKLHLINVEFSSDGSEGSLSDLNDIIVPRCLSDSLSSKESDCDDDGLLCVAAAAKGDVNADSADDELSTGDVITFNNDKAKLKKKVKKRSERNKSPRRQLLLKKTGERIEKLSNTMVTHRESLGLTTRSLCHHGRNFLPKANEDESEMECDFSWVKIRNKNKVYEFTDVNPGEKTLMVMWNEHVTKYNGAGIRNLESILYNFIDLNYSLLSEENVYVNFICHMASLQGAGLISMASMLSSVIHLQELLCRDSLPVLKKVFEANLKKKEEVYVPSLSAVFSNLLLEPMKEEITAQSDNVELTDLMKCLTMS